jgi:hypothetical protein
LEEEAEAVVVLFPVAGIAIGADLYGGEVVAIAVAVVVGPVEEAASAVLAEEVLAVADQAVVGKYILGKEDQ